jgi:HlyD family secretion protein
VQLAQAVLEQWQAKLAQLKSVAGPSAEESKTQAQAALKNAQQTYDRVLKLQHLGFATQAMLDDARKAFDVAQSQVRAADLQVTTSQPGGMALAKRCDRIIEVVDGRITAAS